jgi:predicted helicase
MNDKAIIIFRQFHSRFVYSKTFLYVCTGLNVDKMKQAGYFFFINAPQVMRTGGSFPPQRRDEQAAVSEFPEALMKEEITGEKPTPDVLLKLCKAGDFIIHSVNDVLKQEFGRTVSNENVNILDPFTGTGTFITRLIQSGLIAQKDLERKYKHELFANEIVLLAYYIAAVNIENAFHDAMGGTGEPVCSPPENGQTHRSAPTYIPFDGICLTDTFQLGETDNNQKLFSEMFPQNSERVQRQKNTPITVIMGNPPYSIGQKSANDNAQNQEYTKLNERIETTYAKKSNAGLNKSLYDAYIKAFRWSADRLGNNDGVIAFVSNGAWLDGNSTDGFRKCLEKEFNTIYVFNLRGNQRTSGELSRKEGGKIFGSGSRTPIAITILVKKKNKQQYG